MVEFAIVGPIFFLLMLVIFEVAYDSFLQSVLDTALQATARQIQIGNAQTNTTNGATTNLTRQQLINNFIYPNSLGLLNAQNIYVRVERIDPNVCTGGGQDIYDATSGTLPVVNGQLEITNYGGNGGIAADPTACQYAPDAGDGGYCVAGPSSSGAPQFILMSAVYIAPSFLGGLVLTRVIYGGRAVRGLFSTAAFVTEGFPPTTSATGNPPPC